MWSDDNYVKLVRCGMYTCGYFVRVRINWGFSPTHMHSFSLSYFKHIAWVGSYVRFPIIPVLVVLVIIGVNYTMWVTLLYSTAPFFVVVVVSSSCHISWTVVYACHNWIAKLARFYYIRTHRHTRIHGMSESCSVLKGVYHVTRERGRRTERVGVWIWNRK